MQVESVRPALRLFAPLYEFCFTPSCYHCQTPLRAGERRLCAACRGTLIPISPDDPLLIELHRRLCGDGIFDACTVLYRFEKGSALQTLLHELKYGGKRGVGEGLGRSLGELRLPGIGGRGALLIPIPLHAVRLRERGYNQAELLCAGIAAASGGGVATSVVRRIRDTPTQTSLGIGDRLENVRSAFGLSRRGKKLLRGREVFLVDDVITTGATLCACGAVLREAGVARLTACGVAVAAFSPVS